MALNQSKKFGLTQHHGKMAQPPKIKGLDEFMFL